MIQLIWEQAQWEWAQIKKKFLRAWSKAKTSQTSRSRNTLVPAR